MRRHVDTAGPETGHTDGLARLWDYLSSWVARDGGVNGPVVHRGDLKRMFAIHDTPWTQHAVIVGLLHLHRRSGRDHWLACALRLGDAQCTRQETDGRFRWAGHEDDRFSSLVHNALAASALLDLASVLRDRSDAARRHRYVEAAERNLEGYVIDKLYRADLAGFAMNPIDYYAGRDRLIVNMNGVAIEALVKLDLARGTRRHGARVRTVGERIRSLQSSHGPSRGGLPYSHLEPDLHIPLYTALSLRGLRALAEVTGDEVWRESARAAVGFLARLQDPETGLWYHKLEHGRLCRFPIFVAGAGMICNGILDAAALTGSEVDTYELAGRLLRFQNRRGAIRNFIGYDHPDNGRRGGSSTDCWEDVYPTPSWNAQAFHFLCRAIDPPEPPGRARGLRACAWSRRYVYVETRRVSAVVGMHPPGHGIIALFVKRWRYGLVVPGPRMIWRATVKKVMKLRRGRSAIAWLRKLLR